MRIKSLYLDTQLGTVRVDVDCVTGHIVNASQSQVSFTPQRGGGHSISRKYSMHRIFHPKVLDGSSMTVPFGTAKIGRSSFVPKQNGKGWAGKIKTVDSFDPKGGIIGVDRLGQSFPKRPRIGETPFGSKRNREPFLRKDQAVYSFFPDWDYCRLHKQRFPKGAQCPMCP